MSKNLSEDDYGMFNISTCHLMGRPVDAVVCNGPNSVEDASVGEDGKSPTSDEAWYRRVYALNKQLAEDMGEDVSVIFGDEIISVFFDPLVKPSPRG